MSRKPEPSFKMKEIIWDIAATVGVNKLEDIRRQVDYELQNLRKDTEIFEDTPDIRTIKRIVQKDINELSSDVVVAKLPRHVWCLRHDYESLKTGDPLGPYSHKLFDTQETAEVQKGNKPETCQAPPDNIDVNFLKKNRIPPKKAPGILYEWRSCHREGSHDKCCLYQKLIDALTVKGIPFERAEALLRLELTAKYLGSEIIQKDADLARIYRPWENKDNWEIYLKEVQELRTPGPLKKQHLDEVTDLLRRFQEEVKNARAEQNWDITFNVEQDPLFANMMDHCNEIQWDFDRIKLQRFKYEPIMKKLISTIARKSPPEANEDFAKFVVRYAVNRPIHHKLPDYSMNPHDGTAWWLTIQEGKKGTNIAIGSQERIEQCRVLHIDLISVYKRDPAIKKLRSARREILIHLKSLHEQINDTLTRQDYFYTLCSRCIQLRDE